MDATPQLIGFNSAIAPCEQAPIVRIQNPDLPLWRAPGVFDGCTPAPPEDCIEMTGQFDNALPMVPLYDLDERFDPPFRVLGRRIELQYVPEASASLMLPSGAVLLALLAHARSR